MPSVENRRCRRLVVQAALLICACLARAPEGVRAATLPSLSEKDWVRVDGRGYSLFSGIDSRTTQAIAARVEQMLVEMEEHGGIPRRPPGAKVLIFPRAEQLQSFRRFSGVVIPHDAAGFFVADRDGGWIAVDGSRRDVAHLVCHEIAQYFIDRSAYGVPLWLSEGIAEIYSWNHSSRGHFLFGDPVTAYLSIVRNYPVDLMPLFGVTRSSPAYSGGGSVRFYASAWLFAHYVMFRDGGSPARLTRMIPLLRAGQKPEVVLKSTLGWGAEDLEKELREHARREALMSFRVASAAKAPPEAVPTSEQEILLAVGYFLRHSPGGLRGEERGALNLQPFSGEQALARGEQLLGRMSDRWDRVLPLEEAAEEARAELESAISTSTDDWRAWSDLGLTYVLAGDDPAAGAASLNRARELAPSETEPLVNLALLGVRNGDPGQADCLLQEVAGDGLAQRKIRESMAGMEVRIAHQRWQSGDLAEVVERLDRARMTTADEGLLHAIEVELQRARRQKESLAAFAQLEGE